MLTLATQSGTSQSSQTQHSRDRLRIFSGSANVPLAEKVAAYLGVSLGTVTRKHFADGEAYIQFQESIRGCDVFLLQPTCNSVNERLMELLIMIDACKRASACQVTAVLPYYGYARADRRTSGRESITAKLVSDLIAQAGATRVLALDLHSPQIPAYFDVPIDHVSGFPVLVQHLLERKIENPVVVSPDIGGVARARAFAKALGDAPLAIIDKRRATDTADIATSTINVIGDVKGKTAILVDDIIDTGNTLHRAARALRNAGVVEVLACACHGVLSAPAIPKLNSNEFDEVIITDTIPLCDPQQFSKLTLLTVADLLGESIRRIHQGISVSNLLSS